MYMCVCMFLSGQSFEQIDDDAMETFGKKIIYIGMPMHKHA